MAFSLTMRSALVAIGASAVSAEDKVQIISDANPAPSTLPPYDCHAEYDMWKTAWTPDWKEWCCKNEQLGCPSTTTTTATSSTATSTTRTATTTRTSTVTTTTVETCDEICSYRGANATCGDRVVWSATYETANETDACEAAHVLVVSQCSMCGGCSPKAAGCHNPSEEPAKVKQEKSMTFRKKFEEPVALSGQVETESTSHGAGLGFFARCSLAGIAAGVPLAIVFRRSLRRSTVPAQQEGSEQSYERTDVQGDEEEAHE